MKKVLMIGGLVAVLSGLLFTGQGLGYIAWPSSSFMIRDLQWAYYGSGIAVFGVILIVVGWRRR